jgi:hypothetical protein
MLASERADLLHVNQMRFAIHVIRHEVVVLAAEIHRRAVREVPTLVQ